MRELGEGEFLVLAQVVDQDGQGVEFLLLVHEIYFDKFHEKYRIYFMGAMDMALEALLFEQEQALQGCTTRSDAAQLSQLLSDDFF